MPDFDKIFAANEMTPAPDMDLLSLLDEASEFLSEANLMKYLVGSKRFNTKPMHVVEKDRSETIVYWFRLRAELETIPAMFAAGKRAGLSTASCTSLIFALMDAHPFEFAQPARSLELTTNILAATARLRLAFDTKAFKSFLKLCSHDGEIDRCLGIALLGLNAGLSLTQSLDVVRLIYARPGIAGYRMRSLYDELDGLEVNVIPGNLLFEVLKAVINEDGHFQLLTELLYLANARTPLSQKEVCEEIAREAKALGELPKSAKQVHRQSVLDVVGGRLLADDKKPDAFRKERDDYFPKVDVERLVNGILPYRAEFSFEDGMVQLQRLMKDQLSEGAWIYDPDGSVWYSLGGRTMLGRGDERNHHEFLPYDVSALSRTPVFVRLHPEQTEIFVAPSTRDIYHPGLSEKLVGFLSAIPTAADFASLDMLKQNACSKVEITALLVTSQGVTEFKPPEEPADVRNFLTSFRSMRASIVDDISNKQIDADIKVDDSKLDFSSKVLTSVKTRLPFDYDIKLGAQTFDTLSKISKHARLSQSSRATART